MSIELRNELRAKYGSKAGSVMTEQARVAEAINEHAFVIHADSGRTVMTVPIREIAQVNPGFTYLRGRFVEADTPNRNNAMWTTEDLQLGAPTVAGGPLNWLHEERKVIGTLIDGTLVSGRDAAAEGIGNHIVSNAVMWKFLYANEVAAVEHHAAAGQAFFSMECISREIMCLDSPGRPGCGESFAYGDVDSGKCCAHLRDRSSVRRLVDPLFLGGAVLVPPVSPGWANANVEVMRDAAALTEKAGLTDVIEKPEALAMVAQILDWANRSMSTTMTRTVPIFQASLLELVDSITYKPNWAFYLSNEVEEDGSGGLALYIISDTADSFDFNKRMRVRHAFLVPNASYTRDVWAAWIFDRVRDVETHEAGEFFRLDGVREFAPHHSNGEDPYRVWHVSDWATAAKSSGDD